MAKVVRVIPCTRFYSGVPDEDRPWRMTEEIGEEVSLEVAVKIIARQCGLVHVVCRRFLHSQRAGFVRHHHDCLEYGPNQYDVKVLRGDAPPLSGKYRTPDQPINRLLGYFLKSVNPRMVDQQYSWLKREVDSYLPEEMRTPGYWLAPEFHCNEEEYWRRENERVRDQLAYEAKQESRRWWGY